MRGISSQRVAVLAGITGLGVVLLLAGLARPAHAVRAHLESFEATYPDAVGSRIDTCTLCHTGGSARNVYGAAYKSAGDRFAPIEGDDSDGDGFTNLEEIVALTFPGNADDTPMVEASPTPTTTPLPTATRTPGGACTGDCTGDGTVQIDELIKAVNIALGSTVHDACMAADRNGDGAVTIDELLAAVNAALGGCG